MVEEKPSSGTGRTYVYGVYLDEVISVRDEVPGSEVDYFYHSDDMFNVIALTDDSGAVVERYEYGDYGAPEFYAGDWTPRAGTQFGNSLLFTGRWYDPESGWYDFRARYMDPEVGRFTTRDPLGIWGDVVHLGNGYTYANNNPWSMMDPFGLEAGSNLTTTSGSGQTTWYEDFRAAYNDPGLWEGYMNSFGGKFAKGMADWLLGGIGMMQNLAQDPLFGPLNGTLDVYDAYRRDPAGFRDSAVDQLALVAATALEGIVTFDGEFVAQATGDVLLGGALAKPLKGLGQLNGGPGRLNQLLTEETGAALNPASLLSKGAGKGPDLHGNDLNTTKPAQGYTLRDRDSGDILKYGETTQGPRRYTQPYLETNNARMVFEAQGTKREMHQWNHEMILNYKAQNGGARPPLNKSDY